MTRPILASLLLLCSLGAARADDGFPEVTLVAPGKAPTRTLRFTPTKGMTQSAAVTLKMQMGIKMGTADGPVTKMPALKMAVDFTVTDVDTNGDIRYDFKFGKVDVEKDPASPPSLVARLHETLNGAEGITGKGRMTSRGFSLEMDLSVPETMNAQLRQMLDSWRESMRQLTAPLPAEAVGVGAKWQTKQRIKQNGIEIQQTGDNELVSLKGNLVKVRTTIEQTADRQPMNAPGLAAGSSVELVALVSTASAETEIDLTRVMTTNAFMQVKSNTRAHIKASGQEQDMATDLALRVDVKKR